MLIGEWTKHTFIFKTPGGTSRGVLKTKPSWIIKLYDDNNPTITGYGECSIIPNLSIDDIPDFENQLNNIINTIDFTHKTIPNYLPAIQFGIQTALLDLKNGGSFKLFNSSFTSGDSGILLNGLIWMGTIEYMKTQIKQKLEQGFRCLKLKIGALNTSDELSLLKKLRDEFSSDILEIRVDANGAFSPKNAPFILNKLHKLKIHSIEQPIKQKQWDEMKTLCHNTPLPIALDEELIGISDESIMSQMILHIKPQFIIIKPGLLGGFNISDKWINIANECHTGWWITSALEGNIGLNAIAQWTATKKTTIPQGLGTGQVFSNNITSPLEIHKSILYYNPLKNWDLSLIKL
ncbi:MAG: o-succinylbenzoate synthase [Marinilabiliaceae bacterium]|nr:o-succinylbenzoate synthase [Marinilabiliaceae bacterium]